MDVIFSFLLAALALTGSPGPNTLSVAAVGASFGRVKGLEYMMGLNIGMVGVIAIVGSGMAGMVLALPGLAPIVTILAAAYFLYLAYRIATAPPLAAGGNDGSIEQTSAPRWYEGVGLSLINPKAYAAMAALFSGYVIADGQPALDALWKAGLVLATITTVNLIWLSVGAAMTGFLSNPKTARTINIAFAILLLASVTYAILG
ncbi:MAG: LysE family translocator [Cohaesibacteraceae bacterium]